MTNTKSTLIYLSLIVGLMVFSCKDKSPPVAEITVVDKNSNPVANAKVMLYCSTGTNKDCDNAGGTGKKYDVQTSDASGKTTHTFKLPAVLKIKATKDSLLGEDYVKLVEHETVQKTVTMQ